MLGKSYLDNLDDYDLRVEIESLEKILKFNGGKSYVSFFRDEDYPVFARSGAIIPMSNNEVINDTTPPADLGIEIYPGQSNEYDLYEDDGLSDLYRKGYYLLTKINYNYLPNNYTVIVKAIEGKAGIVPDKRNYEIRFRNTKHADEDWYEKQIHHQFFPTHNEIDWQKSIFTEFEGVASSSGYGDGGYDCYVARNNEGEIIGIRIVYISEENDD